MTGKLQMTSTIKLQRDWNAPYNGGHYISGTIFEVVRVQDNSGKYWAKSLDESSTMVEIITKMNNIKRFEHI